MFVTTEEAAFAAGVKPATLRQWARRGKLRCYGSPREAAWSLQELMRVVVGRD